MPVRYILSSVWVRLSIWFSHMSIIQYMGLCVFSFPISLVMIERIYTLSYYHHQIGSMNCYPLFRLRSCKNGMRYMSLYILIGADVLVTLRVRASATMILTMLNRNNSVPIHWGRVTHICVGKLTNIDSDNGLSPERRQAIIWTNVGILLIGTLGTNFSEFLIGIHTF